MSEQSAPSPEQVRDLGQAVAGELIHGLGRAASRLTPEDRALIVRVGLRAAAFAVESRVPAPDDAGRRRRARRKAAIDAQLASVRSAGRAVASEALWAAVERVAERLTRFALDVAL